MYAHGRIEMAKKPAIIVPAQSVVIRDGRNYVLKIARPEATRVSLQAVAIRRRPGDEVEIVSGHAGGARRGVQGAGFRHDGDVVRLAPTAPTHSADRPVPGGRR